MAPLFVALPPSVVILHSKADKVRRLTHGPARVDTAMIANGNHEYVGYVGEEAQVAQAITRWIQTEVEGH
jgi:hypothetical protein